MLVFAAIVPHPTLIIPAIGKGNEKILEGTIKAYRALEENLYASKPDTAIIVSPHGEIHPDAFTLNLNPEFSCGFEQFGDLATKISLAGDIPLGYRIREHLETKARIQLISEEKLDHGCAVPTCMILGHLPEIKIIPLYPSALNLNAHYEFGKLLKREIIYAKKRIALIVSGDLSHSLTKNSPAKYSPKAKKFDRKIVEMLKTGASREIIKISEDATAEVHECGLKSIAILSGALEGVKHSPRLVFYEAPLGVGYLTIDFGVEI